MTAIRAVIVDDEELARSLMREYLTAHPEVEVVAECTNGFEAVRTLQELQPDLVFLDIQMPKLDGFEVLELAGSSAAVIFVTAYDEYAIRAFEVHAVDYLLKPFSPDRLTTALARAREKIASGERPPVSQVAAAARPKDRPVERIVVQSGTRIHVIGAEAIDYIEAQDDYAAIHSGGREYLKQQPLAELEALLDPERFVRIHRSYLLNLDRLVRLEPYAKESRVAVLADGTQLPVSRSGYARLRALLE